MSLAKTLRLDPGLHNLRFLSSLSEEERKIKINEPDELGDTPLHIAAAQGTKLAVDFLVKNGANLNTPNNAGSTPLHKAVSGGLNNKDVINYLLDKCDWVKNSSGLTPFELAYEIMGADIEIYRKLLAKEEPNPYTEIITIPADTVALVCGKRNSYLARIRGLALTHVEIDRLDKNSEEKERVVTLVARNQADVEEAKKMIASTIKFKEGLDAEKKKQAEAKEKAKEKQAAIKETKIDEARPVIRDDDAITFKTYSRQIPHKSDFPQLISKLLSALPVPRDQGRTAVPPGGDKKPVPVTKIEQKTYKKLIEEQTATTIKLPKKNSDEPIIVQGDSNNVAQAIQDINALRPEKDKMEERKLFVTKSNHKFIIGKKKFNIARIREEFGVNVIVPLEDSPEEDIILRGAASDIELAKLDIVTLLKALPGAAGPQGYRGPRPNGRYGDGEGRGRYGDGEGRGRYGDGEGGRGGRFGAGEGRGRFGGGEGRGGRYGDGEGGRGGRYGGSGEGGRGRSGYRAMYDNEGERVYRRIDGQDKFQPISSWVNTPNPNDSSSQNQNQDADRDDNVQPRQPNQPRNQQKAPQKAAAPPKSNKLNLTNPAEFPSLF